MHASGNNERRYSTGGTDAEQMKAVKKLPSNIVQLFDKKEAAVSGNVTPGAKSRKVPTANGSKSLSQENDKPASLASPRSKSAVTDSKHRIRDFSSEANPLDEYEEEESYGKPTVNSPADKNLSLKQQQQQQPDGSNESGEDKKKPQSLQYRTPEIRKKYDKDGKVYF